MKVNLINRKVFVDSNAFIYFLTGQANSLTCEIFTKAAEGKIKVVTSVRVIDETLFKLICIEATRRFHLTSNVPKKLRKDKEKVKALSYVYDTFFNFLKDINTLVLDVDIHILAKSKEVLETYGLFGNDAITVALMKSRNMKYILTADNDFSVVDDLVILHPLEELSP
jgi:predicted nucleic acid-binding protein